MSVYTTSSFSINPTTGNIGINSLATLAGIYDVTGTGSALRILNPGGASYSTLTSVITGAIKITLPQSWTSTMMRMTVKIYTYDGLGCEINLGGYNFSLSTPAWYNTFADMTTGSRTPLNVRWGYDGTYCCMYIGETTSTWNYPQVFVTDFQAGYSNYAASQWNTGWSVSFVTSFGTLTGGTISTAGVVYGSSGNFTGEITAYYSSDINLKENINEISNPLEKLQEIRGVSFDWKDSYIKKKGGEDDYFVRKHDIGVIAQEVEKVLPEIVAERDDGTKAVKYEKLTALLIESIKEQQKLIETQQKQIEMIIKYLDI